MYSNEEHDGIKGPNGLTNKEVVDRVNYADKWMKRFRDNDIQASSKYIDANAPNAGTEDDWSIEDDFAMDEAEVPTEIPVGQYNPMTINNETKLAGIATYPPEIKVKAHKLQDGQGKPMQVDVPSVVAKMWEQAWVNGGFLREAQAGLQKKGICGLGMAWYRWDSKYGVCYEHIPSKRLFIDPNATNLKRLEYGGVRIKMTLRRARRLYDPNGENELFDALLQDESKNHDKEVVTIFLYFDEQEELHVYNGKVITNRDKHNSDNLYRKVPLLPLEGFIDPRDRLLPLGDNVFASGLNQQVVDLASIASSTAKHGGSITIGDINQFDDAQRAALENGTAQQIIFKKGALNPNAMPLARIPGENLPPAYLTAMQTAESALSSIQGVTVNQRSGTAPGESATQALITEGRAGAKPTQEQADYEAWLTEWAKAFIELNQRFGGPTSEDDGTTETKLIWQCFQAAYEVKVVEGSTCYANPAQSQQSHLQLYTGMVQSFPLWQSMAARGMVEKIPNLESLTDDMYRAFSIQDTDEYWMPAPPPIDPAQNLPPQLVQALRTIYKDTPPDVKREIEKALGLQPSQLGEPEEDEGDDSGVDAVKTALQHRHEREMQEADASSQLRLQSADHQHEAAVQVLKMLGDAVKSGGEERKKPPAKKSS
jgi:hypothetical protein